MDELPNNFDLIVIGTGMPECIIAAAAARIGKTVLHLERNGYYGGDWASFSFDKFLEWIDETQNVTEDTSASSNSLEETLSPFVNENERLVLCNLRSHSISNISVKSFVRQDLSPSTSTNDIPPIFPSSSSELQENSINGEVENPVSGVRDEDPENLHDHHLDAHNDVDPPSDPVIPPSSPPVLNVQQEWTISQFLENRRKFNIDLSPKILFSRGSLVELLISSNIARYAEFQCVNKVLTHINGHIEQVPCSRADVFSTKNVTVVEKRMLMKFLNFCLKYEENENEYRGFEDVPFAQFLKSKKLTPNVEHYILHAIAMVDDTCPTIEGLKSTQKFLQSLGRYGKSPFLCTCYGSAELPQCFCRLCAVFGGMYYLKRDVEAVVVSDRACAIVSRNQRIDCQWLVMESSYAPREFLPQNITDRISRAILITDESLYPTTRKENILLKLPAGTENGAVTLLEMSSKTYVCPEDLFIVYMFCRSSKPTAEEDLKTVCDLLFQSEDTDVAQTSTEDSPPKPKILWCTFFNQVDTSLVDLNHNLSNSLFLTSSPDAELDYEHAVKEAQEIFSKMCPDEEFLPRAPDPEDILIERHSNPGDEGDKIENDVSQPDSKDDISEMDEKGGASGQANDNSAQEVGDGTTPDSELQSKSCDESVDE